MNQHTTDAGGSALTYGAGVAGITLSGLSLNDWLLIFSLVLVVLRLLVEVKNFYKEYIKPLCKKNDGDK